jgi:hypothetical protein
LTDGEKATLLVYISEHGMPKWASGNRQHAALAALTGWGTNRAKAALKRAEDSGYLDTERERGHAAAARARGGEAGT